VLISLPGRCKWVAASACDSHTRVFPPIPPLPRCRSFHRRRVRTN
jgi:hypothetical protein